MKPEFQVHKLNSRGLDKATQLAEAFSELLVKVEAVIPSSSRERSLVITKLQEACFFAKRAIAVELENH